MQGIVPDVAAYAVSVVLTIAWDWVVWIGIIFAMGVLHVQVDDRAQH